MKSYPKISIIILGVALLAGSSFAPAQEGAPSATATGTPDSSLTHNPPAQSAQQDFSTLDRTQSGVRIKLPGEHAILLSIGDSIDIDQLSEGSPGKKVHSVFIPAFLEKQIKPIPLGPRTNYEIATMNSVEDITRKSSLAVSASVSGPWGSASASYNRKRFSYVGKEILQANLDLKTSVNNDVLDLQYGNPAEAFTSDILARIASANASKGDPNKLMMLRRDFRDQYGTCFVIEIEKGARYRVVFSKQIDHTKRIDEQSMEFSASVSAYANKVKTSVKTAKQDIDELQKKAITTTGELEGGPTTVLINHDLESFLQYINDTGDKGKPGSSWIQAAIEKPSKLQAVVVPFSAIPELALLASGPTGIGGAGEVRQIAPLFPPATAPAPKELSPIAEHVQFSPSWGVISFATVPYPIPVAMRVNSATNTIDLGVQCSDDLHAMDSRLASWLPILDQDVDPTYATIFGGDRKSPPGVAKNSSIELYFSLATAHGTGENVLTAVGKGGEGAPLGIGYPPTAEQLYNQVSNRNGFVYWYRFAAATPGQLQGFLAAAASNDGVQLRTVVNLDELNPISLRDRKFRIQKQGDAYEVLSPVLLEGSHAEESLTRLYSVEEAVAKLKASLEIPVKATIDGKRNPIQVPITVGTIPPFATVVMDVSGAIDPWGRTPHYDADQEGGMLIYELASKKPLPKDGKAGKHFRWVNRTGEIQQLRVGHKDRDAGNNSGSYKLTGIIKLYDEPAEPVAKKSAL
jgi:hypothetical protein